MSPSVLRIKLTAILLQHGIRNIRSLQGEAMNLIEERDAESKSLDLKADNLRRLVTLFPDVFAEGKLAVDRLFEELPGVQADADAGEERFGLSWSGKRRARQLALTPSAGTLRPVEGESISWNTTQNLLVAGVGLIRFFGHWA